MHELRGLVDRVLHPALLHGTLVGEVPVIFQQRLLRDHPCVVGRVRVMIATVVNAGAVRRSHTWS